MSQIRPDDLERRREDAIDTLTSAFATNIISMEEYERRASLASAANYPEAINEVIADLPAIRPAHGDGRDGAAPRPYRESAGDEPESYRRETARDLSGAPPMTTSCIMGDRNLTGNWLSSNKVSSFTVMGSTKLDLRDSELPLGPINVEVFTLMGETMIIVPPGLPVRMNASAFMAESTAHRNVNQQVHGAETWVEISGFVIMGSVVVKAMN